MLRFELREISGRGQPWRCNTFLWQFVLNYQLKEYSYSQTLFSLGLALPMVILGHTRTNVYCEYLENKRFFLQRVQNASILLKKWKLLAEQWYFVHIIFCFLYEENIFSCEWLVFWVRSGENSVLKKEKFWITSLRVIPSFSFWNTLFSPRVSQKNSHEQVKIVFFMRQQKIMWTDYFFQFFHGAFQCVGRIVP